MARKGKFEFEIKAITKTEELDALEKRLNGFYKKYEDRSIKIDMPDFRGVIQDIASMEKEYKKYLDMGSTGVPIADKLKAELEKAKSYFKDAVVTFDNGENAFGFDQIMEQFRKNSAAMSVDLTGEIQNIKDKIAEIINAFKELGTKTLDDGRLRYNKGSFDSSELQERIDLLKNLIKYQQALEQFNGEKFDQSNSPSFDTTNGMQRALRQMEEDLQQLTDLNLRTTEQLRRRRDLIADAKDPYIWNGNDQKEALRDVDSEDAYERNMQSLRDYISKRRNLITELQSSEGELFQSDGIQTYVNEVNAQIQQLESYLAELQSARENFLNGSTGGAPIGGNFDQVVTALREVKETIESIKTALDPLSNALTTEGTAFYNMAQKGSASLDSLLDKLLQLEEVIKQINGKDFNIQNFITQKGTSGDSVSALRNQAKELLNVVQQLNEAWSGVYDSDRSLFKTATRNSTNGDMARKVMEMQEFDVESITTKIAKSGSQSKLLEIIGQLEYYRDTVLSIINDINKIKPDAIDTSILSASNRSKIDANQLSPDAANKSVSDTQSEVDRLLTQVKTIREQIDAELSEIQKQINNVFDFSKINPNYDNIQNITDTIYQYFVDLKAKIDALDIKLNIPETVIGDIKVKETAEQNDTTVSAPVDTTPIEKLKTANEDIAATADKTKQATSEEARAASEAGEAFAKAAEQKKEFASANKEAASSAMETAPAAQEEAKSIDAVADAADRAADKVTKTYGATDGKRNDYASSMTEQSTIDVGNAFETITKRYEAAVDEDGNLTGEFELHTITYVDAFKKRAEAAKKEAAEIEKAQADLEKFLSQFNNKTLGLGSHLNGYNDLANFTIATPEDIEKAATMMANLDKEYNKVTQSFRKGMSSMNPFANAINSMSNMDNTITNIEMDFLKLTSASSELRGQVDNLRTKFNAIQLLDPKSETYIYEYAKMFGELRVEINKVTSAIQIQRKAEALGRTDTKLRLDMERQLSQLTKQRSQWQKDGLLTDDLDKQIDEMFAKLAEVSSRDDLTAWKNQWMNLKDAVATVKNEIASAAKDQIDVFSQNALSNQLDEFERKLKDSGLPVDDFIKKIQDLKIALNEASTKGEFKNIQSDFGDIQTQFKELQSFMTLRQKYIDSLAKEEELQYQKDNATGGTSLIEEELKSQKEITAELEKQLQTYTELFTEQSKLTAQQEASKKAQDSVLKIKATDSDSKISSMVAEVDKAQKAFDKLKASINNMPDGASASDAMIRKMEQYQDLLAQLKTEQENINKNPELLNTEGYRENFDNLLAKIKNLKTEITNMQKETTKFYQKIRSEDDVTFLGDDAPKNLAELHNKMNEFADAAGKGEAKLIGFNDANRTATYEIQNEEGQLQRLVVMYDEGTNSLGRYVSKTTEATSGLKQFVKSIGSSFENVARYIASFGSVYKILSEIRQGVQYVREIDTALTELKKVTNETDATYSKFLQTMSKSAGVVGSTVKDLTNSAAD